MKSPPNGGALRRAFSASRSDDQRRNASDDVDRREGDHHDAAIGGDLPRAPYRRHCGDDHRAHAHSNEKTSTGAFDTRSASSIVASLTWLRSTSMPRRLSSSTTDSPNSVSPSCLGSSVAESAHSMVPGMRQREVTGAQCAIGAQHAEAAIDLATTFHADQRRNSPALVDAPDIRAGAGHRERLGIALRERLNERDLLECLLDLFRPRQIGRHPYGPELPADHALAQPGDIRVVGLGPVSQAAAQIHRPAPIAFTFAQHVGPIVVSVDQRCRLEHAGYPRPQVLRDDGRCRKTRTRRLPTHASANIVRMSGSRCEKQILVVETEISDR